MPESRLMDWHVIQAFELKQNRMLAEYLLEVRHYIRRLLDE